MLKLSKFELINMENGAFFFGVVHKKNEQANDEHNVQSHFFFTILLKQNFTSYLEYNP